MNRSRPAAVALVGGVVLGVLTGVTRNQGGYAALGALLYMAIGALIVLALGVITIGALVTGRRPLAWTSFVGGAALVAAMVVAAGAVSILGVGSPHVSVTLTASAAFSVQLDSDEFIPAEDGTAECGSAPDSIRVAGVVFEHIGDVNGGPLRARLELPRVGVQATIRLFADASHLRQNAPTPAWMGPVTIALRDGDASGTAAFIALPLEQFPLDAPPTEGWPETLSGELGWRCEPWHPTGT